MDEQRLIDANAFRLEIDNHWPFTKGEQSKHGIADMAKSTLLYVLENMPTIEERKTGKWIEFDSDEDRYDIIKRPCCKHTFTVDSYHWTDIGFVKDDFKFCPNCGCRMKGEEDE